MALYQPPTEYFTGIIFNPLFYQGTDGITQETADIRYLQRTGVPTSVATLTTFTGDETINGLTTTNTLSVTSTTVNAIFANDITVNTLSIGCGTGDDNSNSLLGWNALNTSSTALNNTAIGYRSLQSSNCANNTAIGFNALSNFTLASGNGYNTSVGSGSGTSITSGTSNVSIGTNSLSSSTSTPSTNVSGCVSLGASSVCLFNNSVAIGSGSTTSATNQIQMGTVAYTTNILGNLSFAGTINTISASTFAFLSGVTSSIQGQFNALPTTYAPITNIGGGNYAPITSPTFLTSVTLPIINTVSATLATTLGTSLTTGSLTIGGNANSVLLKTLPTISGLHVACTSYVTSAVSALSTVYAPITNIGGGNYAPIASPTFTGTVRLPLTTILNPTGVNTLGSTLSTGTLTIGSAVADLILLATAPTTTSTSSLQVATTGYVNNQGFITSASLSSYALLGSPNTFTSQNTFNSTIFGSVLQTTNFYVDAHLYDNINTGAITLGNTLTTGLLTLGGNANSVKLNTAPTTIGLQVASTGYVSSNYGGLSSANTWTNTNTFNKNTTNGVTINNTCTGTLVSLGSQTGGTLTTASGTTYIVYTSGSGTFTAPSQSPVINMLVVGGGGGGGGSGGYAPALGSTLYGGGGGGGGATIQITMSCPYGSTFNIAVGSAGNGGQGIGNVGVSVGGNSTIIQTSGTGATALSLSSGGGNYGYANNGGGGNGSGGVIITSSGTEIISSNNVNGKLGGAGAFYSPANAGTSGLTNPVISTPVSSTNYWGSSGGGGSYNTTTVASGGTNAGNGGINDGGSHPATSGTANFGGGGGGAYFNNTAGSTLGGNGGSGYVIIWYTSTATNQLYVAPTNGSGGYNSIAQAGDGTIIYTDDQVGGYNSGMGLVIAPHSASVAGTGLRMDSVGNMALSGKLSVSEVMRWYMKSGGGAGNGTTATLSKIGASTNTGAYFDTCTAYGYSAVSTSWNATTATFTAPSAGLYNFQLNVFNNSTAVSGRTLQLISTSLSQYLFFEEQYLTGEGAFTVSQMLYLNAGDTTYYYNPSANSIIYYYADGHTTLQIFKIC